MKKRFCILVIGLIIAAVLPVQGRNAVSTIPTEKNSEVDFNKEPVRFMAEIYKSYHNWRLDHGIKRSKEALAVVDMLYAKDPNAVIKDPKLKLNKALQIKSTLHTLAGMLYFRKSLESLRKSGKKEHAFILEKLKKGKEITEKDFEELSQKVEQNETSAKDNNFLLLAKEQFAAAIDTDPANPAPHFQLAGVYRAMGDPQSLKAAEKHYYTAARLAVQEGDNRAVDRALESLKSLNPRSPSIKKLESLKKR
jgi:hypothetical protein